MAPLDFRYTQVGFNLISVEVWAFFTGPKSQWFQITPFQVWVWFPNLFCFMYSMLYRTYKILNLPLIIAISKCPHFSKWTKVEWVWGAKLLRRPQSNPPFILEGEIWLASEIYPDCVWREFQSVITVMLWYRKFNEFHASWERETYRCLPMLLSVSHWLSWLFSHCQSIHTYLRFNFPRGQMGLYLFPHIGKDTNHYICNGLYITFIIQNSFT